MIVGILPGNPYAPLSTEVRDWIIRCNMQNQINPLLKDAVAALSVLLGQ